MSTYEIIYSDRFRQSFRRKKFNLKYLRIKDKVLVPQKSANFAMDKIIPSL